MNFAKIEKDISKLLSCNHIPDHLIIVSGGKVSSGLRTKIDNYALLNGIQDTSVWSAVELEEKVRCQAPDIFKRFFAGDAFPESL